MALLLSCFDGVCVLSPISSSSFWAIDGAGYLFYDASNNSMAIRPAISLKSSVKISSGNGSKSNPFAIQ